MAYPMKETRGLYHHLYYLQIKSHDFGWTLTNFKQNNPGFANAGPGIFVRIDDLLKSLDARLRITPILCFRLVLNVHLLKYDNMPPASHITNERGEGFGKHHIINHSRSVATLPATVLPNPLSYNKYN